MRPDSILPMVIYLGKEGLEHISSAEDTGPAPLQVKLCLNVSLKLS